MKLFRRSGPAKEGTSKEAASSTPPPVLPPKVREISLSAEQKTILETPVNPRVEHILEEIYADRATAERALKERRVIEFPQATLGEPRVVQDKDGSWRIVPATPENAVNALEAL